MFSFVRVRSCNSQYEDVLGCDTSGDPISAVEVASILLLLSFEMIFSNLREWAARLMWIELDIFRVGGGGWFICIQ